MAEGLGKSEVAKELTDSLKRAVAALQEQGIPYLLGGGLGCWARGGPPSSNDIDLMVKPEDAERAQEALVEVGMRADDPPEHWLLKAWDGDILLDLIFEPSGMRIDDETIGRGEELSVMAMQMRVMDLNDILVTKLLALDEHSADYRDLILITRSLREQIDWARLRQATASSPFALAFFALADGLDRGLASPPRQRSTRTAIMPPMLTAVTAGELQGWVALVAGLGTAMLGLLKYFDFRSRSERASAAGEAFAKTVDDLAAEDEVKRLAGAILLRRFFSVGTEQGEKDMPYAKEALGVIAASLRDTPTGTFQKLLADGLAHAPDLGDIDLQGCNLQNAYLGERPDRRPDFRRADFFEADLSGASLKQAGAREAVFFKATCDGTVFQGAELQGADFREADLRGARFDNANLAGARFDGARNIPDDVEGLLGADRRVPGGG
jgi:hypothetical protein